MNALSQKWHLNGFSSVCSRMWLLKLPDCVNARSQYGHLNGRSPVCILIWLTRLQDCAKPFVHTSHLYGLSPVWVRICMLKLLPVLKDFRQNWQVNGSFGLRLIFSCFCKWVFMRRKNFLHTGHFSRGMDFRLKNPFVCSAWVASSFVISRTVCRGDWNVCSVLPCLSTVNSLWGLILKEAFLRTGMMEISGSTRFE